MSDNPGASCGGGNSSPSSSNGNSNNGNGNGNSNGNNNNSNNNDEPSNDLIQPRGISLRVDIQYDQYPEESSWLLYDNDSKQELYWSDYGDVTSSGLQSVTFSDLAPGTYVFLLLDSAWDGICCSYGRGFVKIYEVFPEESGQEDELRWQHDGRFWNAAGSTFRVVDSRRELRGAGVEVSDFNVEDSPYVPSN